MKKLLLILLCLPLLFSSCKKEEEEPTNTGNNNSTFLTWIKTFQGFEGRDVQQTSDEGYIITGTKDNDMTLIKTDANGIEQWSQTFGSNGNDHGFSVKQTSDGGYIICGTTYSFGNGSGNVYLIKTDENGNEQWNQTFGGTLYSYGCSVEQTTDGGYIIAGGNDDGSGVTDAYLVKTDNNRALQWEQNFGDFDWSEIAYSVQQTTDNGFILLGYKEQQQMAPMDVYMIKTDDNGNEEWSQTFGSNGNDHGFSVKQTSDGGYIATGFYSGGGVYLIKTNSNGAEEWSNVFEDADKETGSIGYAVQQTTDGGYIITGKNDNSTNGDGIYLIKTDDNGNVTSTFQ